MTEAFKQPDDALFSGLKNLLGPTGWKSGTEKTRHFEDPRGRFEGKASLIVMPETTEQVSEIVKMCNTAKVGIVPFSGGTGVVAGQLSPTSDNTIVLSLERMNKIRDILLDDSVLVAEAGCILENIHHAAAEYDLMFPLSMASKGSCCIGGNLATNAGGIQVVRHGNARDLCLGVEAVLPDGTIYSDLTPLRKNNTGYDLRHLLIGSEGTLGIITAATLVLKPVDPEIVTVLCALESPAAALALFKSVRKHLGESICALELMSGFGIDLVRSHFPSLVAPFSEAHDWHLLLEASGPVGVGKRLETALEESFEAGLLVDAVIAQSDKQRQNLWELRENTPEANRLAGAFCNSDTSVPISQVNGFIDTTAKMLTNIHAGLRINTYGHIGDGNIHHNVLPPLRISKKDFIAAHPDIVDTVRMAINKATAQYQGSISAEHGIGRLKTHDLETFASPGKLDALMRIKRALDPHNVMNPGVIVP
jgi:FAD/FMN-containing dehydrogenase